MVALLWGERSQRDLIVELVVSPEVQLDVLEETIDRIYKAFFDFVEGTPFFDVGKDCGSRCILA